MSGPIARGSILPLPVLREKGPEGSDRRGEGMEYFRIVMSGTDRGLGASALRAGASVIEQFYGVGMRARNRLFDAGLKRTHGLGRPTISVGNLTAGGTGKTPLVRWLADRLRNQGRRVAILARGYRSVGSEPGDEQRM